MTAGAPPGRRRWPTGAALLTAAATVAVGPAGSAAQEGPPAVEPEPVPAGVPAPPGTYAQPVDVLHYDIELALSDEADWIVGRTVLTVAVTGPLEDPLELDFTGLAVDGVAVAGRVVPAVHEAGRLHVPVEAGAGDTVRVEVRYRGVPDDGLILGRNVHGEPTAFADNWPDRARFWFPGRDHPSDKAAVAFTVHAPEAWQVVANGALAGEPVPTPDTVAGPPVRGGRRSWRWETRTLLPTYNMVVGAADLRVDTVGLAACGAGRSPAAAGCVAVTTWLYPQDTADAAPSFRRAARMVDYFTGLVGPFPFEKLANVQSSTRFGGMENSSAIFYAEAALDQGRDIEGTVSHEIAHQWFGDSVTEADWRHLWLSEGFATYFGALFFEEADGAAAFRARMEDARRSYLGSDVTDRPVLDPDPGDLFALLNANNYQKGGWILHMLRGILGDEAFFSGIRLYYDRHAGGTALTRDLRGALEEASGLELGWFFQQWLERPGHPVLRIEHRWDAGTGEVEVTVHQEQPADWPVFRLPTTLEVRHPGGSTHRDVVLEERIQVVRIPVPAPPTGVVLDSDGGLLAEIVGGGP